MLLAGDKLSYNLTQLNCVEPGPCEVTPLFLNQKGFDDFIAGEPVRSDGLPPSIGRDVDGHILWISGWLTPILPSTPYYVVISNQQASDVTLRYRVEYSAAGCLSFALVTAALLLIPVLIIAAAAYCFKTTGVAQSLRDRANRIRSKGVVSAEGEEEDDLQAGASGSGSCCICEYDPAQDPGPSPPRCAVCCRLPQWRWVLDYPAYLWKRPDVCYPRWWRQQNIFFWPWNPEEGEFMQKKHRVMYVVCVLVFNLLVLTAWAGFFLSVNSQVTKQIPIAREYFARYVGSTFMQFVFVLISKPLITYTLQRRAANSVGAVWYLDRLLTLLIFGLVMVLVIAESIYIWQLFNSYRCDALIKGVLYPYLVYEVIKSVLVFGFVPLPVWYWFLNTYGTEFQGGEHEERGPLINSELVE